MTIQMLASMMMIPNLNTPPLSSTSSSSSSSSSSSTASPAEIEVEIEDHDHDVIRTVLHNNNKTTTTTTTMEEDDENDELFKSRYPEWKEAVKEHEQYVHYIIEQQDSKESLTQQERRYQLQNQKLHKTLQQWENQQQQQQQQRSKQQNEDVRLFQQQLYNLQVQQEDRQRHATISELKLEMSRSTRLYYLLQTKFKTMKSFAKEASNIANKLVHTIETTTTEEEEEGSGESSTATSTSTTASTISNLQQELRHLQDCMTQELDHIQETTTSTVVTEPVQAVQQQQQELQSKRELFLDQLEEKRRDCLKRYALTKEIQSLRQKNEVLRNNKKKVTISTSTSNSSLLPSSSSSTSSSSKSSTTTTPIMITTDPFVPALHIELKRTLQELKKSYSLVGSSDDKAIKIIEAAHWALASKMYSDTNAIGCNEEEILKKGEEAISYMKLEMKQLRKEFELSNCSDTTTGEGESASPTNSITTKVKQPIKWERQSAITNINNTHKGSSMTQDVTSSAVVTSPLMEGGGGGGATMPVAGGSGGGNRPLPPPQQQQRPRSRITKSDVAMACRRRYERLNARRRDSLADLLAAIPDSIKEETQSDLNTKSSSSRNTSSGSWSGYSNESPSATGTLRSRGGTTLSSGDYSSSQRSTSSTRSSSSSTSLDDGPSSWFAGGRPTYKSPTCVTQFVQPPTQYLNTSSSSTAPLELGGKQTTSGTTGTGTTTLSSK